MHLRSVAIKNFRSIESVRLDRCGRLNVLIGKNNAGKSNILNAIQAVYSCIKNGRVVVPRPVIGNEINFHNKNTVASIEITLVFCPTSADRDALLNEISSEAPHVKNAVDGLPQELLLSITLKVAPPPELFAFVGQIAIHPAAQNVSNAGADRVIFRMTDEAARELNSKASAAQQMLKDAKALRDLPERMGGFLRRPKTERDEVPLSYWIRNLGDVSPDAVKKIEALLRSQSEGDDLVPAVRNLTTSLEREASDLQREHLTRTLTTFSGEETIVPKYISSLLDRIASAGVHYLQERRKAIGKEEAQRLLELKMSRGGPQVLRRIQDTVAALLGVQIDAFRGDSRTLRSEAEAELDVDNFLVQVNGSGIREALRLILDYEFEHPSLLLLEEPETHLHPALEASMMRYLHSISGTCQVFLTTHSTNFLDTAELTNIYLVSRSNSTSVELLDSDSTEALVPRELGLRMSSLFMYDRLVFMEGRTDEAIIREWSAVLNVNLSQANVGFIRMGGARNFSHYAATATLAFLSKRRVQCWILIDRDEKTDGEVERLKKLASEHATVHVLEHSELSAMMRDAAGR